MTRNRAAAVGFVLVGIAACTKAESAPPYSLVPVARRNIVVTATASGAIQPILTLSVAVVGVRAFGLARAGLRYAERLTTHDAAFRIAGLERLNEGAIYYKGRIIASQATGIGLAALRAMPTPGWILQ